MLFWKSRPSLLKGNVFMCYFDSNTIKNIFTLKSLWSAEAKLSKLPTTARGLKPGTAVPSVQHGGSSIMLSGFLYLTSDDSCTVWNMKTNQLNSKLIAENLYIYGRTDPKCLKENVAGEAKTPVPFPQQPIQELHSLSLEMTSCTSNSEFKEDWRHLLLR